MLSRMQVLALPRAALFDGRWPQGFVPAGSTAAAAAWEAVRRHGRLLERDAAEVDPAFKQPIPYCTLVRPGEVFCVERLPRQGEGRLHGRWSIGLGGHIEPDDLAGEGDPILAGLRRELAEEVGEGPAALPARFLGLVNDETDPVGQVHFGLVFCLEIPRVQTVQILESSKMRGAFRHLAGPAGPWQDLHRFESWSRILLEARAVEALADSRSHCTPKSCGKTQEEP